MNDSKNIKDNYVIFTGTRPAIMPDDWNRNAFFSDENDHSSGFIVGFNTDLGLWVDNSGKFWPNAIVSATGGRRSNHDSEAV